MTIKKTHKYQGYILDVDGTLVDSNDFHAQSWMEAFSEHNFNITFEKIRPLIGMGGDKLLEALTSLTKESSEGEKIAARAAEIFKHSYLGKVEAFPGATALVGFLKEQGKKLAVASSAEEEILDALLKKAEVLELIDHKVSSADVDSIKPDPDVIHIAIEKLSLKKDEIVMVGDTVYDIEAARKAGIGTIALRCGGSPEEVLLNAIEIYSDPAAYLTVLQEYSI